MHSHVRIVVPLLVAGLVVVACFAGPTRAAVRTLVVEAGDCARQSGPVSVEVPEGTVQAKMLFGSTEIPCQVVEGKLWWILPALPAGDGRTYSVTLGAKSVAGASVAMKQTAETIDVAIDGKPFTSYVFAPKPSGAHVLRRPFFFPVYGPGQATMTRPFPMVLAGLPKNVATDHPHHTSIYVAHGAVNGVDNWSIGAKAGYQVHKAFECVASGAVMGIFRETLDWTDVEKKPVMAETRTVRIYRMPDTARLLDIEIAFKAAYGEVVFGDTKEGGLCAARMRPEFRCDGKGSNGKLVTSEGDTAKGAWGKKATWVDCSGEVEGKRLGLAILDGPGNLRHPTTWHARTYGLLTANPFGLSHFTGKKEKGDYTLETGKERTWRYRIYFHEGDEKQADVAGRFADYATPAKAVWK